MTRSRRWLLGSAAALLVLAGGLALLVQRLLPNDEELASLIEMRFEAASGIGLRVGTAHWALRPVPVVLLTELATEQKQPITARRIVVQPRLAALWQRNIAIDSVEVEGVVLPRASVRAFRGRLEASDAGGALGAPWALAATPVERVRARDLTWIDRRDIALAYDADIEFDPGWRPRTAELARTGVTPPARLRLDREGTLDRWNVWIDAGGGTWNGSGELKTLDNGRLRVTALLEPKAVDIAGLVGAFNRHNAVEGRIEGRTELEAEGEDVSELIRALHTRTRFSIRPATLKGFDLARLARTAGQERSGQTVLEEITGTLDTQAGDDGIVLRYSGLQARSGVVTVNGSATVLNRRLDGEAAIDLVDGVVGLPFKLSGTLDAPLLSLTGGALAGAAVGSALLPGVGTAIGARIGQQVEKMLGGGEDKKKPPRAAPAPRAR